ncbi:hypothetical protein [Pseudoroseomonas cervicalis]|uniref:hypothetical protein n=1 Tax=Teichococcus cervicalis TaxID=204525 RepID=UPI002783282E|nr:hypothetical protein [Pseudoroseomonas cervicalis]MDQ1080541.1 hypothetical protein [Pseudoroseomonas cervicalis]
MRPAALGLTGLGLLWLGGCDQRNFGHVATLATEAETRLAVVSRPAQAPAAGLSAVPAQITCLEPSPDVAKALSTSHQASASAQLDATPPQWQSPASLAAAASASRARSEAMAQLTERMATIQLLRDGLYRACEAYANGAVGPISYALILSRYGDTMVTLLGAETAAGAFGRAMAGIGGAAQGDALAGSAAVDKAALEQAETRLREASGKLSEAQDALNLMAPDAPGRQGQIDLVATLKRQEEDARRAVGAARETATRSTARATVQPGGAIHGRSGSPSESVAQHIAAMQKTYMEVPHLPPLLVACVTALSTSAMVLPAREGAPAAAEQSRFRALCDTQPDGRPGLLMQIVQAAITLTQEEAASRHRVAERQAGLEDPPPGRQPPSGRRP